ncbi:MAG: tRNA (guanosine(46)-N7)-methyltransferase TrmB [Bacteroidota bacterium]
MPKRKLKRFAENETFPHFFQPAFSDIDGGYKWKGRWKEGFFKNENPLVLELGCGKGEFTVGLGRKYPEKNFIGIDLKGARMWRGAKSSHELKMQNVAFVRTRIEQIEYIFGNDEVNEIWITFPDPQPNKPRTKKRLTSPLFLDRYRRIAAPGCIVHLKTDNSLFFEYTLSVIEEQNLPLIFHSWDVDKIPGGDDVVDIRTHYEEIFREQGDKIKYLRFRLC